MYIVTQDNAMLCAITTAQVRCLSDFGDDRLCRGGARHIKAPDRRYPRQVTLTPIQYIYYMLLTYCSALRVYSVMDILQ
jgi:hypothetical protein